MIDAETAGQAEPNDDAFSGTDDAIPEAERAEARDAAADAAEAAEAPAVEPEEAPEGAEDSGEVAEAADVAPGGDTLIPIAHPDGGTTDALKKDEHGNFLCRAEDYVHWFAHGFRVVAEKVL